jgi:hypothetical protein
LGNFTPLPWDLDKAKAPSYPNVSVATKILIWAFQMKDPKKMSIPSADDDC